jgi:uncharacterized protein YbjT (DUF2867 family)
MSSAVTPSIETEFSSLQTALAKVDMLLGPTGVSAVDVRDIAEAAAIALASDGHEGKTYNFNGPEVFSGPKGGSQLERPAG